MESNVHRPVNGLAYDRIEALHQAFFLSFSLLRSDTHSPSEKTRDEGENKTKIFNAKIFTALNWTRLSYLTFRHVYVKITNATFGGLSIYSLVLFIFHPYSKLLSLLFLYSKCMFLSV